MLQCYKAYKYLLIDLIKFNSESRTSKILNVMGKQGNRTSSIMHCAALKVGLTVGESVIKTESSCSVGVVIV